MPLMPKATAHDKSLGLPLIPLMSIEVNYEQNCRMDFTPTSCVGLAEDVRQNGLLQPIIVRGVRTEDKDKLPAEHELVAKGKQYVLLAGYRRWTAYKICDADVIPAVVHPAYMSEFEARDINAKENIQREDLTLGEECNSIKHYFFAGWGDKEVADALNKSVGWVQPRMMILKLPKAIMDLCHKGLVQVSDVRELYKLRDDPRVLLETAAKIRDIRRKGAVRGTGFLVKQRDNKNTKKLRSKTELRDAAKMIRKLFENCDPELQIPSSDIITVGGNSILTRLISWVGGEISSVEFYESLQEFCRLFNIDFDPEPLFSEATPAKSRHDPKLQMLAQDQP